MGNTIFEQLLADGWREYPVDYQDAGMQKRHFQKRTNSRFNCQCNENPPSINAYWHQLNLNGSDHESWKLEVRAETKSRQWVNFQVYAIAPEDFPQVRDAEVARLIRCWEAANDA